MSILWLKELPHHRPKVEKGDVPREHKFSRGKMKSPLQKRGKDRVCIVGGRTGLATGGDIKESIVKLDLFDKRCIENSTSRNRERTKTSRLEVETEWKRTHPELLSYPRVFSSCVGSSGAAQVRLLWQFPSFCSSFPPPPPSGLPGTWILLEELFVPPAILAKYA
ncbi:hypothetical protein CEXT_668111 [Caerostris extrusa]|uniref:Uncharacterized protein n=1 Tax=Caerostris extrusa TaxID=172846 RepID=A0AAV4VWE8_CAEEX|nr:hypothetical protein CEXT_668111 [Caerostris extrusa]